MREPTTITELRRRLTGIGCPAKRANQIAREVAEHHEDLRRTALEEGMTANAAETLADEKIGDVVTLTEQFASVLRRRSWWGRHPFLTFCVFPPIAIFVWVLGAFALAMWIADLAGVADRITRGVETHLDFFRMIIYSLYYGVILMVSWVLCWLARSRVHNSGWALTGCAMCSAHGLFHVLTLTEHSFSWGYGFKPAWFSVAAPWLILGGFRLLVSSACKRSTPARSLEVACD